MAKARNLVVDSGGFIKCSTIQDFGDCIFTVHGVVTEIKDKATRERLALLPYELNIKQPDQEAVHFVTEFSKASGDFSVLSSTDLQLLALCYQLEKETVGTTTHLHNTPKAKKCSAYGQPGSQDKKQESILPGFYVPKQKTSQPVEKGVDGNGGTDDSRCVDERPIGGRVNVESDLVVGGDGVVGSNENNDGDGDGVVRSNENNDGDGDGVVRSNENNDGDGVMGSNDNNDGDEIERSTEGNDDDRDGWINSENISEISEKLGLTKCVDDDDVPVACLTTDFAMQNVLLQIGLKVVSVNGMLIKHTKNFIKRCYGCFKLCSDVSAVFCPNCGNQTLKRVEVVVGEDGSLEVKINLRRPINTKGMNARLPKVVGGKHGRIYQTHPDERLPQQRVARKALAKTNVFDPAYTASESPFATRDVTSRAFQLGRRGDQQQEHRGRRKKRK